MAVLEHDPWSWAEPDPGEEAWFLPAARGLLLALALVWVPPPLNRPGPGERAGCPGL